MNENIARALSVLPVKPGVYIMRDINGKIIYVGKAVVLKNRVKSYFRKLASHTPKVKALVAKVNDIETIVTDNELEALILECNLIKEHRPKYNISLKDDKSYPYLKITMQENFPRIYVTRRQIRDGAKYYGPYADAGALHATVKLIRELFPLRNCRNMNVDRPCLQYHIKRCLAPCAGLINREEYGKMIKAVCLLIEGRTNDVLKELKQRMQEAAAVYNFEEAARLRDQWQAVLRLGEQQKAVTSGGDQDAIAFASDATGVCLQIFFVRGGKLVGRDTFFLSGDENAENSEIITAFLKQYYFEKTQIPPEILVSSLPEASETVLLEAWLTKQAKHRVELIEPKRGLKRDLLKMVEENAEKNLSERLRKGQLALKSGEEAAEELQKALELNTVINRMECFDISHTQGSETVASMVVFVDGVPSKKDYRRFKINSTEGKPDDFKSMQEVVLRRYKDMENLPDLIIIDGGKGQLSSALEVIRGLGLHEIPVIGLAKREEEIFKEGISESLLLDKESDALKLIQRIRDEAHRFAITYHRKLRGKRNLVSVLDHIEGVGSKRREELWRHFGSLEQMKQAQVEELAAVKGMNYPTAQRIYDFFRMDILEKNYKINK
ncbi:MAG TPA: excinuclease ABC subunit UvrC [Candidatus Avacidaminococcus intestinavium]|uniref:UvrABC system protein C n=1 Tax=Candidatus Avacidaminococcus intestinavium TaxID=2840684 RepID=A0A9D1MQB4_9FIRM|nr:excinuclease ABC subunit UvrC [Candidatus Avacidaminococcus intestinavium]